MEYAAALSARNLAIDPAGPHRSGRSQQARTQKEGGRSATRAMNLISRIVLVTLALVVIGGAVFLASWDIPAPSAPVEKAIPNDRLFR